MALAHLPTFFCAAASRRTCFSSPEPSPPTCRKLTISCSARKPSGTKRTRVSRPTKSNEDLCRELQEFMSLVGLPKSSVPLIKELCQHGRKDLASLVRRRGYNQITELLSKAMKEDCSKEKIVKLPANATMQHANIEEFSAENENTANGLQNKSTGVCERGSKPLEDGSFTTECSSTANDFVPIKSLEQPPKSAEQSIGLSLHEKAANFVQSGELDFIEDIRTNGDARNLNPVGLQNHVPLANADDRGWISNGSCDIDLKGKGLTLDSSKFSASLNNGAIVSMDAILLEDKLNRNDNSFLEGLNGGNVDKDMFDEASKTVNQVEVNHLKAMLHQKEMELSQLKQEIENEKLALANLQDKATTVIGYAQKMLSEKDAELHAAEDSLTDLKEVLIEYQGCGDIVELAGSFNGWHHRVSMVPESLGRGDVAGSGQPLLWSTVLWLYPGVYEIRFIVDGQWKIDAQRATTSHSYIQNNILRVDG